MTRTLTLQRDGQTVGEVDGSIADFTVPRQAADYRLTYDVDTSRPLPVSTRVTTSWTFRSAGPTRDRQRPAAAAVGRLRPAAGRGEPPRPVGHGDVHGPAGTRRPTQAITSFTLSASLDRGATWQSVRVSRAGDGPTEPSCPNPPPARRSRCG